MLSMNQLSLALRYPLRFRFKADTDILKIYGSRSRACST